MTNSSANAEKPLISIITVVRNGAKTLDACIQSIIGQSYEGIEFIVIDGGSTDGTLDILRRHNTRIAFWVSESDKGIYDAMNKGTRHATGSVFFFSDAMTLSRPICARLHPS